MSFFWLGAIRLELIAVWFSIPVMTNAAEPWSIVNDRGNLLREQGRCREAVPVLVQARTLAMENPGNGVVVATANSNLGAAFLCLRQYSRAEKSFRQALDALDRTRFPEMTVAISGNLSILLMHLHKWRDAEELLRSALDLSLTVNGPAHRITGSMMHNLAVLWLQMRKYDLADDYLRRALAIFESANADELHTAAALNSLGVAQLYRKQYQGALEHTARALELRRKLLPSLHPQIAESLYNHAVALEKTGDRKSAQVEFRTARSIRTSFAADNLLGLTVDRKALER